MHRHSFEWKRNRKIKALKRLKLKPNPRISRAILSEAFADAYLDGRKHPIIGPLLELCEEYPTIDPTTFVSRLIGCCVTSMEQLGYDAHTICQVVHDTIEELAQNDRREAEMQKAN